MPSSMGAALFLVLGHVRCCIFHLLPLNDRELLTFWSSSFLHQCTRSRSFDRSLAAVN